MNQDNGDINKPPEHPMPAEPRPERFTKRWSNFMRNLRDLSGQSDG